MTKTLKKLVVAALLMGSLVFATQEKDVLAAAPKVHTVTFLYGTKSFAEPVVDGGNAIAPTDTYVAGYSFMGWVGSLTNVTEDRIILGSYAVAQAAPVVSCSNTKNDKSDSDTVYKHWWECDYDNWHEMLAAQWREENQTQRDYWDAINRANYKAVEDERTAWRTYNKDWREAEEKVCQARFDDREDERAAWREFNKDLWD